jgi:hypothetical protein
MKVDLFYPMKILLLTDDGPVQFPGMTSREIVMKAGGGDVVQALKQFRGEDSWLSQLVRSHAAVPMKPKDLEG